MFQEKGFVISFDSSRINFLICKVLQKEVNDSIVNAMIEAFQILQKHKMPLSSVWIRSGYCGFTLKKPFSYQEVGEKLDRLKFNLQN